MPSKRIVIFGATGNIGQALIQQALNQGHIITAFVRNSSRLLIRHDRLQVIQGNVLQPDTLPDALRNQDAVLCALGRKPFVRDPVCSAGTKNVLVEMARQGTKSIVVVSSLGVGDSFARSSVLQKAIFSTLLRTYLTDKAIQEHHIRASHHEWTIVRPVVFTNSPATGLLRADPNVHFKGLAFPSVSRLDVARFMLDQLANPTFLHQCPTLY